jgi:hypothetical protein
MFCVYYAEWVLANEDIAARARRRASRPSRRLDGAHPPDREDPRFGVRPGAQAVGRFGLTPSDEYDLFKSQQIAAALNPGLFDHERPAARSEQPMTPSAAPSRIAGRRGQGHGFAAAWAKHPTDGQAKAGAKAAASRSLPARRQVRSPLPDWLAAVADDPAYGWAITAWRKARRPRARGSTRRRRIGWSPCGRPSST